MSKFSQFLEDISDFKERPVKLKQIKKVLKINEKSFPPCKNILNYYFQEFSKRTNEEHRTKWHRKDKILFVWTVLKYFEFIKKNDLNPSEDDWHYLSNVLGVTEQLLNLKWISMLKTNLKMAPWNPEEDEILQSLITDPNENKNWTQITIDFNRINPAKIVRHAKQIRERWNNYLNPDLKKSEWSQPEQLQLLLLVQEMGKRWSLISKKISGRTENQVKNQYNSMMNTYRRQNLDNEDIAIKKLLANLQGKDYEGPLPLTCKRIRKTVNNNNINNQNSNNNNNNNNNATVYQTTSNDQKNMQIESNEIKEEHQQDQQLQSQQMLQQQQLLNQQQQLQQQQQQQSLMLGLPVFSPMLPFSPLHYLIKSSPNNISSPYEMRNKNYSSQLQLFDEYMKSTNNLDQSAPQSEACLLRLFNSPAFNHQGFPYATMPYQQPTQQQPAYNTKKINKIQKELLKFDKGVNRD
ncbi:unnamed protein product (macronuclear) [Paramecium tetraurelia]|uniref:Uncharacterized protein n=1 Tax=Paramecium tetraurelia TaxID=5888 RepID=A0EDV5_PARTE|nr:uncharacterized protein GSPATT00025816001 [Paramecium tetraurelia]CAK93472.1 unnamed protein product [Paramecium tetraurelia]|eukprot:XP_001460869.1 hypothetical protein (macronuclear) [Paramecium tetraurelia strain d4-2]